MQEHDFIEDDSGEAIETVFFRGKVYIIDLNDLRKGETKESVLRKLVKDGMGMQVEGYKRLMQSFRDFSEKVCQ